MANFSEIYRDILADHRKWLAGFSKHAAQWERRLRNQPETAIVEACVRNYLASQVDSVEPAEDLASGGPDFCCRSGPRMFYVESTCLTVDAVTKSTNLSPSATGQAGNYGTLTDVVKRACVNKASQLGYCVDAPGLLAIGTLHFQAGDRLASSSTSRPFSHRPPALPAISIPSLARPSVMPIRPLTCGIPRSLGHHPESQLTSHLNMPASLLPGY